MHEIPPPPDSNDPQFRRPDGGVDWAAFRAAASAWAAGLPPTDPEEQRED